MHRLAVQFLLLFALAVHAPGCARRLGRDASLEGLSSKRSESLPPITSRYATADAMNLGKGSEGGATSPANLDKSEDAKNAAETARAPKTTGEKNRQDKSDSAVAKLTTAAAPSKTKASISDGSEFPTPDRVKSDISKSDVAGSAPQPPDPLTAVSQEELEKMLANSSELSPLVRQQLLGLLEFSRQKADAPREANAVALSAPENPSSPSDTTSSRKNYPTAASQAAPSAPPGPSTGVPHVTVNVTTTPSASPELPTARPIEKEKGQNAPRTNTANDAREPQLDLPNPPALLSANSSSRKNPTQPVAAATIEKASYNADDEPKKEKPPLRQGQWRENLLQALDSLDAELRTDGIAPRGDEKTRLATYLRLLNLIADRREDALKEIDTLDKEQKEYWKKQLLALAVALDAEGIPAESRRSALALRHLREAATHLAAESTLDVRNLAFCSKVDGYGVYSEFPKNDFKNDQEVLLYVEVDNFAVEEKSGSRKVLSYETELRGTYEIYDSAGHRVADCELPLDKQTCRNQRRDYFIAYRLYMPKRIDPGAYTLRLSVEDVKGRKHGQASIDLAIKP